MIVQEAVAHLLSGVLAWVEARGRYAYCVLVLFLPLCMCYPRDTLAGLELCVCMRGACIVHVTLLVTYCAGSAMASAVAMVSVYSDVRCVFRRLQ